MTAPATREQGAECLWIVYSQRRVWRKGQKLSVGLGEYYSAPKGHISLFACLLDTPAPPPPPHPLRLAYWRSTNEEWDLMLGENDSKSVWDSHRKRKASPVEVTFRWMWIRMSNSLTIYTVQGFPFYSRRWRHIISLQRNMVRFSFSLGLLQRK